MSVFDGEPLDRRRPIPLGGFAGVAILALWQNPIGFVLLGLAVVGWVLRGGRGWARRHKWVLF